MILTLIWHGSDGTHRFEGESFRSIIVFALVFIEPKQTLKGAFLKIKTSFEKRL